MAFGTSGQERARITSGGNVLIGTTSDVGATVNINGNVNITSSQYIRWGNGNTQIEDGGTGYNLQFKVYDGVSALLERMRITSSGNIGITQTTFGTSATRTLAISTGTAPSTSPADCFQLYSADITAGNAAAHFRTENGAIIKVYQETTAVAAATPGGGGGTNITDTDTFDGYTIQQVVRALRNQGLLA